AEAAVAAAVLDARSCPLYQHLGRRLVAGAAVTEHWAGSEGWAVDALIDAEHWFNQRDLRRVGDACAQLLRQAGVRRGRTRTDQAIVAPQLRRRGVTAREAEVLRLLEE